MKRLKQKYETYNLNVVKIINSLLGELNLREKDILTRRFGLHGRKSETLEGVGSRHGLTRERIRQIENSSIKKLANSKKLDKELEGIKNLIKEVMEEHGGIMEKKYFLENLIVFSLDELENEKEKERHKRHIEFLLSKLLKKEIEEIKKHKNLKESYKLKESQINHLQEVAEELHNLVKEKNEIFQTKDLFEVLKRLESYNKHKEKLEKKYLLDISEILKRDFFVDDSKLINENKTLYSILKASRALEQNKFGYWGYEKLRQIKPKTINDKIYLVLKDSSKPMHFSKIADRINEIGFDKKKANVATIHNELILDPKYVLIGRGLYGLKEWGLKSGTVADIIKEILMEKPEGLGKEEIAEKVLEIKKVKKSTVFLALTDKNIFAKKGNKYKLK